MTYPISISLAERLGTDLSSRTRAAAFRRQVIDLVESGRSRVTIDWDGIQSISESFADELLGVLVKERGEEWFRDNVSLCNLSSDLREFILTAISRRLTGPALQD